MIRPAAALAGLVWLLATPAARADDFELQGFGDYRLVLPSQEESWTDGGLGKTRWGGGDGPEGRFGAAGVVGTAQLLPDLQARADLQFTSTDRNSVNLVEAYLRYRPVSITRWRYSIKAGAFLPPVSMENDAIGWTSPYTLTPSAINSWVGEELLAATAEARLEWRGDENSYEVAFGLFGYDDPAGAVLAARGWSFSDLVYGVGGSVREPDVYAEHIGLTPPQRSYSFQEIDQRPGYYANLVWRSREWGVAQLTYYNNDADPSAYVQKGLGPETFAWHTKFWAAGASTRFEDLELAAQAMTGSTTIEPGSFDITTNFQAGYLLAAYTIGEWQPALRFDLFSTQQEPDSLHTRLGEHGHALTAALNWRPLEWVRLTAEYVRVDSWRVQRLEEGLSPGQADNQAQLAARLFF